MRTYDAYVAPAERRLLIRVLQGVVPRAFAIVEELSLASALPVRCERLYFIGRSEQKLEVSADHAETETALVDYWRLRVTQVAEMPSAATLLRSLFGAAVVDIQFLAGEEFLEAEDERICSHGRIVLREDSGRSIGITAAEGVSGAIQLNVEV